MEGKAYISLPGVDVTSVSLQNMPAGTFKTIKYAEEKKIPLEVKDMVASSVGIGAMSCEGLYKSSSNIVGIIPAKGLSATFTSGDKVTLASLS